MTSWQLYKRVLSYLAPYKALVTGSLIATFGFSVFDSMTIIALAPLLNAMFNESPVDLGDGRVAELLESTLRPLLDTTDAERALPVIIVYMMSVFLLKTIFDFCQTYLVLRLEHSVTRDMRNQSYRKVLDLDMRIFNRTRAGQILTRLTTDTDQLRLLLTRNLSKFATSALLVLISMAAMFLLSWQLTVLALVALPAMFASWHRFRKRLRRGDRRVLDLGGEVASHLQETVAGIRLVKSAASEEFEANRFRHLTHSYFKAAVRNERLRALGGPLTEMIGAIGTVLLLWFGARLVLVAGTLSAPEFLVFLGLAVKLYTPAKYLSRFQANVQPGLSAAERIFEFMDAPVLVKDQPNPREFTRVNTTIRFEDVGFEYEPGKPVLEEVSFEVPVGSIVALVGPSGAGKSTLVDLVARFYDPTHGRITVDGVDLRDFSIRSLRSRMGVVAQDTVLFHDTVRANIAYGLGDVPQEAIERAAHAANAHDFIMELPQGYDTVLGERGTRLSGGQRQRIAIARAILRDPAILILDEATSALDTESERLVQEATDQLLEGRTVFVIAHRLSTIRHADRILVVRGGQIVESGRHDELLSLDGAYRRLYDLQFATR